MKKLLSVAELADYLSVNEMTIRRMVKRGQLTAVRIGRAIRFDPDDVAAFIATVRTDNLNSGKPEGRKA